ncbi:protein Jade-3-like isoform X2 [Limulus polyphemus]|uniref:Protein Jade-3-like isoform X2 n=1 Tax=Limulus polyphemus TaxID=6850 RepID=A0ABM1BRP6_LIMPO|nr:protein Jade-3-like isoform X2 [Limulus polyphemus]
MASASKGKRNGSVLHDSQTSYGKKRRKLYSGTCSESEDSRGPFCASTGNFKFSEPSMSKIYNSSFRNNKPAELFRKDLISAMKLSDSDQLFPEDFWFISDPWKQEWEKGVQVPVNPDSLPETSVRVLRKKEKGLNFKLPKKFIRCSHDHFFSNDLHILTNVAAQADKVCRYDLDSLDVQWLKRLNDELDELGQPQVEEEKMEYIIEDLETQCFTNLQEAIKSKEGLDIEYDEDVICDVCRSPDSEEGNEMVFCDSCNVCVHQACYGITKIPEGSWLCKTCTHNVGPSCLLCPNKGGAMKNTSDQKWAHVSCALWIPEVRFRDVVKMEPLSNISDIPSRRWSLVCTFCQERKGCCIQCSVKTCKTAYHVTCAFKNNLDMKAIVGGDRNDDEVKLRSYCKKHSRKKGSNHSSDSENDSPRKKKNEKKQKPRKEFEMSCEEWENAREKKIKQISSEFYNYVNTKETAELLQVDPTVVDFVYQYWKLKRKAQFDKPLLTPKEEESDLFGKEQEDSLYACMKMFVQLRQDIERVRNLCYMVNRREKLFRSWLKVKEEIFQTQVKTLADDTLSLTDQDIEDVIVASQGSTIYDKFYSKDSEFVPSSMSVLPNLSPTDCDSVERLLKEKKETSSVERLTNQFARQSNKRTHYQKMLSLLTESKDHETSSEAIPLDYNTQSERKEGVEDTCTTVNLKPFYKAQDSVTLSVHTSTSIDKSLSDSLFFENVERSVEEVSTKEVSKDCKEELGAESEAKFSVIEINDDSGLKVPTKESYGESKANELGQAPAEIILKTVSECETSVLDTLENVQEPRERDNVNPSLSELRFTKPKHVDKSADLLPVIQNDLKDTIPDIENIKCNDRFSSSEVKKEVDIMHEQTEHLLKSPSSKLKGSEKIPLAAKNSQKLPLSGKIPKKDVKLHLQNQATLYQSPEKEKLREESAKICESIFSNSATSRGSLSGYRIPKKTKSGSSILENTRSNSPLSPLSEVSTTGKESFLANVGFRQIRTSLNWDSNQEVNSHSKLLNGEMKGQSRRLVIKLRKDPNYPDSHRWKRDSAYNERTDAFKVVQNDWQSPPKRTDRHLRSDRKTPFSDPPWVAIEDCGSKENGANSKYSVKIRNSTCMQTRYKS